MRDAPMSGRRRPALATLCAGLLAASGLLMIWLGTMANAYYVCAFGLWLAATLLWKGFALGLFEKLLIVNQVTAILLLVVLLTGVADLLHLPKLTISAVLLLAHLASGGPLMGILAIPLLLSLQFGRRLHNWFASAAGAAA